MSAARRQAVLLIHGIGEQRPMDSLRAFVDTVWTADRSLHRNHRRGAGLWSKPYVLSDDFELRRLTTARNKSGLRTDFFELYWAHLMHGTTVAHILAWARSLLLRHPRTVPRHLAAAYWVVVVLLLLGSALALRSLAVLGQAPEIPAWVSLALSAGVVPIAMGVLLGTVGDAARYLHVAPGNVHCRHAIRSAGIAALKALHAEGYERIVVVGHSLGSVIGYDILSHLWAEYSANASVAGRGASVAALQALEAQAAMESPAAANADTLHRLQRDYFNELKANGGRWRVTDFVTLGSPLAHAEILLARDAKDLAAKFAWRELPRCPPQLEETQRRNVPQRSFSYLRDGRRVPHHAAVFGPTRWTNLYFPSAYLLCGDLIGGPLRQLFGPGVKDVPLTIRLRAGFLSHILYWTRGSEHDAHIETLRAALDLLDRRGAAPHPLPPESGREEGEDDEADERADAASAAG